MKIQKKEHWFKIQIFAIDTYYNEDGYRIPYWRDYSKRKCVFEMTLKADHYKRKQRFFDLKNAQFQNQFRDKYIQTTIHPISKAGNKTRNYNRDRSIAATKGQITKIQNAMADYDKSMSETLFFDKSTDKIWQKAEAKLSRQRAKLKQLVKQKSEVSS